MTGVERRDDAFTDEDFPELSAAEIRIVILTLVNGASRRAIVRDGERKGGTIMAEQRQTSEPYTGNESIRTGLSEESIRQAFLDNLLYVQGRFLEIASVGDQYRALAFTIRDRLLRRWVSTIHTYQQTDPRTVCYLSAEYLPGPFMGNNLLSLGMEDSTRAALASLGIDLDTLIAHEEEPGLGNGGLGRLAACFMDSLATLQVSAISYGIRYEFGIFDQVIRDGVQVETTDNWLRFGSPWEVRRPHIAYDVKIGDETEHYVGDDGIPRVRWVPDRRRRGAGWTLSRRRRKFAVVGSQEIMVRREFSRGNCLAARVTALVALDVPSQTAGAA